jgi:uncharacterized protein (DUF1778 family)
LKRLRDVEAKLVKAAEAAAQKAIDDAKAIKLTSKQQNAILSEIGKLTKYEKSDDA